MSDVQGQIIEVAHDLLAIEVNTIVKPNMTATRMRNVAHTLLDIISEYDLTLCQEETQQENPEKTIHTTRDIHLEGEIQRLSQRARDLLDPKKPKLKSEKPAAEMESNRYVVARIRDNCDTILGLFDALKERPGSGFTAQTVVSRQNATRRTFSSPQVNDSSFAKSMGTETVMMQTVIHLNGDVFTRMNGLIATGDQRSTMVVGIHTQGVQKAVEFWDKLSSIVVGMFKTLFAEFKL
ncbi:MAG: hypothetical protein U0787_16635 [Polyangia bacterium]